MQEFQTTLNRICTQSELLALMIRRQEKNLAADNQATEALQQQQQSLFPDSAQSHSSSTAVSRAARPKQRPNQQKKNSQPNIALMRRQINELQKLLSVFKNEFEAVNKSRVEHYTVMFFSDSAKGNSN